MIMFLWIKHTLICTHSSCTALMDGGRDGELYLSLLLSPIIYSAVSVLYVVCMCLCVGSARARARVVVCFGGFMALTVPSSLWNELFRHTVAYSKAPLVR